MKTRLWGVLADAFYVADITAGIVARMATVAIIGGLAMVAYGFLAADDGQAVKAAGVAIWLGAGGAALFVAAVVVHWIAAPAGEWADGKWSAAYEAETGHPPVLGVESEDE